MSKSRKNRKPPEEKPQKRSGLYLAAALTSLVWLYWVLSSHYGVFPVTFRPEHLLGDYISFKDISVLPGYLGSLAVLCASVFSLHLIGSGLIRLLRAEFSPGLERFVFSGALGLVFIYLYLTLLSAAGLVGKYAVYPVLLGPLAWGAFLLVRRRGAPAPASAPAPGPAFKPSEWLTGPLDYLPAALLLGLLLFSLAASLTPEIFYDSLLFHLGVPNQYKVLGGFAPMPYNQFSNMPMAHGMIYLFGLVLKDEILAKLLSYWASVLIVLSMLSFARRFCTPRAGLWGAAIFYSIFHVTVSSWQAGTEMFLTLFTFLSFYLVLLHQGEGRRYLLLSGVFSGMAVALKYTGGLALPINLAVLLYRTGRPGARFFREAALFCLAAFAVFSPWLIKNYRYVGNPVYPFATAIFKLDPYSSASGLKNFQSETQQKAPFSLKGWLSLPFQINAGKVANNELFTPLFLGLLPAAWLLVSGRTPVYRALYLWFGAFYLFWSLSTTVVRYLMPAFPVAALIISASLAEARTDFFKKFLLLMAAFSAFASFGASARLFHAREGWQVFYGYKSKSELLGNNAATYPSGYYYMADWINKNTRPGARVLLFGDARTLYYERPMLANSVFDKNILFEYLARARDEDELRERFRRDGVDYIAFNVAEAIRTMREYRDYEITPAQAAVYDRFYAKYMKEVYARDIVAYGNQIVNKMLVYELSANDAPGRPNYLTGVILKAVNGVKDAAATKAR
ncbi:MAG: glycosyltransferase family 39 protein [Elusimicrobiales bacterium]